MDPQKAVPINGAVTGESAGAIVPRKMPWHVLNAALWGWALDAMDFMILALVLVSLVKEWNITMPKAGLLMTATQLGAAFGGMFWGVVGDYLGRRRTLMLTILWYSILTGVCALAQSWEQMVIIRFVLGLGLGGEWGIGATLVAEWSPPEHRGKYLGIVQSGFGVGYGIAALLSALIVPVYGWRYLFLVGVVPALLTFYIRRTIEDPQVWVETNKRRKEAQKLAKEGGTLSDKEKALARFSVKDLFSGGNGRRLILCFLAITAIQMAWWGTNTWIPAWLAKERGLTVVRTGFFVFIQMVGAVAGYLSFGFICDKLGRKKTFYLFLVISSVVTIILMSIYSPTPLLIFLPVFAFFTFGPFSGLSPLVSELFPTRIRATATSTILNSGRIGGCLAPYIVAVIASHYSITIGIGFTAVLYIVVLFVLLFLPETLGTKMETG